MFNFIRNLFKTEPFTIYHSAPTVPQAFGYSEEEFQKLVNELTFFIKPTDRIATFANYIKSPIFQNFKLDVNQPNHAAILGYAFCLAIILQHELQHKTVINDVLNTFAGATDELINPVENVS